MTTWTSARLTADHDTERFDSGQVELDRWLRQHAVRAASQGTAVTWVWTAADSAEVVAFVSTAPTQVLRDSVMASQAGGVSVVPAYLIARLALDRSLHGQGLGGQLLLDALERILSAAEQVGGRLIVVDAIDEAAASFYSRYDLLPTGRAEAATYPRRLVMKVATARAALGL